MKKNNYKEIRIRLALGGLFHDIGKVKQRAGEGDKESNYKDEFKYFHSYLTDLFFRKEEITDPIIKASAYHHSPFTAPEETKLFAKIYQLSDFHSSAERSEEEKKEIEVNNLRSIFQNIFQNNAKDEYAYLLKSLSLEEGIIFPKKIAELSSEEKNYKKNYSSLWESFIKELKIINSDFMSPTEKTLSKVYHLIYKYFWCVPASTYDKERKERHYPDISLFDHLRVVSAFASALYTDYNLEILKSEKSHPERELKVVFIKGDISGIQKFLYGITNFEGVAKRLRGRSTFLALLSDLIARSLLRDLDYPFTNILYSAGGHFEVLIGYEEGIEDKLSQFEERVDEVLFKEFYGGLGLVLSYTIHTLNEFSSSEAYRKVIQKIHSQLDKKKKRKFVKILGKYDVDRVFELINEDYKYYKNKVFKLCESCKIALVEERGEEEVCIWCKNFQDVGTVIPKSQYILFSNDKLKEFKGFYLPSIGGVYFIDENNLKNNEKFNKENWLIYAINKTNFLNNKFSVDGFKFMATCVPIGEDEEGKESVMTFEKLVEKFAEGDKKLAFARADVDNLGYIFMKGLGENYSISRIATLSRGLDLFFSGYLNHLFTTDERFKNKIYVLYAGGDDLFIIGPWNVIIEAIKEIRKKFKEYCCNNENFDLSCGIFMGRHSYPVRFAGDKAGEAEDEAKKKKPAINVFGETLTWDEFERALPQAEDMAKALEEKKIHRSLFYKLYLLLCDYKEKAKKELPERFKFYPIFYYYVYRNVKDKEKKLIDQIMNFFLNKEKDYKVREEAIFKAKYTITKTRE